VDFKMLLCFEGSSFKGEVTQVYSTTHVHSNWYNNMVLKYSVVGGTSKWG